VVAALASAMAAVPAVAVAHRSGAHRSGSGVSIAVLSGRADLVSDGSALVAIQFTRRADAAHIRVSVGRRSVTSAFAWRADGRFEGLVTGLTLGRSVLRATLPDGSGARIALVNHPVGGPVFSGPQLEPWKCQLTAVDRQCDQPPRFGYVYMSTNPLKGGLQPYDPRNPPSDVALTTTDQGVRVPFIVRIETGYMDRDQYQIATLFQPGTPWTPFDPQRQWNHKLLITHGASCGIQYQTSSAPASSRSTRCPSASPAACSLPTASGTRWAGGSSRCQRRSTTAATTATSRCRRNPS
jgi:hypothetical protein